MLPTVNAPILSVWPAVELRTGQEICLWREQMGCTPPIDTSKNSLVVGFAVDTEIGCFNALGWRAPVNVLDLRIEWLQAVNFTPRLALSKKERKNWSSLLHVMSHYGLDAMDALEKQRIRDLITRGEPFTDAEPKEIENYNLSDVRAYRRLFLVMVQRGHIPRNYRRFLQCLFRGRCMCSMARMEWTGVPINTERHSRLVDAFESGRLKKNLIETLGKRYGVFDEKGSFREKRFIQLLNAWDIGWPLLPSGRLDLKDRTFKMMAQIHPELEDLRQLLYCLEKLKLRSLIVGSDAYARCWLNPYGSRTGRYQPSNAEFIFGPAVWMRAYLIQAKPGWVLIYLDYEGQEFGIAAALSGDPAMLDAYNSGDIYIAFGKQAGLLPAWATKETHRQQRDQLKVCVLATQIRENCMHEEKFSERGIIPEGTVAVTIGVDSQSDGFYWLLACWGRKMELWLPLTDRITGDMRGEAVWKALFEILTTTWLDHDGNAYRPVISALDVQGDFYPQCLEFVRAHGWKCRLRAVRGYGIARAQAAGRTFGVLRNKFQDKAASVTVTNIDVDIAKSQVANMLARRDPGPGYVHLPCGPNGEDRGGWDQETIAELTAEYRRQTNLRGYTISRWYKKSGRPNHRLDCLVYALAALAISLLKIDNCALQRVEARNVGKSEQTKDHAQSPFGARKMFVKSDPEIGGLAGYGVELPPDHRRPAGWGALPGSGVSF
jgi:hypothetical protein